jgi:hypothetical protein
MARTHLGQEPLKAITRFVDQEIQHWSAAQGFLFVEDHQNKQEYSFCEKYHLRVFQSTEGGISSFSRS